MIDEVESGRREQGGPPPEPAVSKAEAIAEPLIILAVGLAAAGLALCATWLVGVSVLDWLKTGNWSHPTLIEVVEPWGGPAPTFEWVIVQRVTTWCLNLPSALIIAGISVWLFGVTTRWDAEATERRRVTKIRGLK